jgi:hypothetical protein
MFINNYSVRVLSTDGIRQHTLYEDENGYVYIPHNTQYVLNLRNTSKRQCEAEVTLDGKHVGTWVLGPKSSVTLERPANDHGRFTFFESGSQEFKDAAGKAVSKDLRGLISVKFMPERKAQARPINPYPRPIRPPYIPYEPPYVPWPAPWQPYDPWRPGRRMPPIIYGQNTTTAGPNNNGTGTSWTHVANLEDAKVGNSTIGYMQTNSVPESASLKETLKRRRESGIGGQSAKAGVTGLSGNSNQQYNIVNGLNLDHSRAVTINLRLVSKNVKENRVRPLAPVSNNIPPAL